MNALTPVLFIDHDGTLVEEPPDRQVDKLEKIRFMPGVFAALNELSDAGYRPEGLRVAHKGLEELYLSFKHTVNGPLATEIANLVADGDRRFGIPQ